MNFVLKYRNKPVVIEAMRFTYSHQKEVAEWCGGTLKSRDDNFKPYIQVHTLEGTMTASLGDYVIKGVKGEFYPCKPEIFNLTYEEDIEEETKEDSYEFERPHIDILRMTDNDDGSMDVLFETDIETLKFFASIGIKHTLVEKAKEVIAEANLDISDDTGC